MIIYIDWKCRIIPDPLLGGIILTGTVSILENPDTGLMSRILAAVAVCLTFLFLICLIPGGIGGGDIKLMAAAGYLLGIYNAFKAFAFGIMLAGVYVLILLVIKKADRKTEIALGPFLCIGVMYVLWMG